MKILVVGNGIASDSVRALFGNKPEIEVTTQVPVNTDMHLTSELNLSDFISISDVGKYKNRKERRRGNKYSD